MTAGGHSVNLRGHTRVAIDTNVLIYLFEDAGTRAAVAGDLLDLIASGGVHGVLATLVLTEICTYPAKAGDMALVERYADEVRSLDNVRTVPLDADVAVDAAAIRGSGAYGLSDAVHLATARSAGATAFVTNDRRIGSLPDLEVLYLDDLAA